MVSDELIGYGKYAFVAGFIVALLSGFVMPEKFGGFAPLFALDEVFVYIILIALGIIGLFIAFFGIKAEDELKVLVAIMTLLVAAIAVFTVAPSGVQIPTYSIRGAMSAMGILIGPLAAVISLRSIFRAVATG